jgi:hypothetical protein
MVLNGEYRVSSWHVTDNATIRRLAGAVQEVADALTPMAGPDQSGMASAPGISYEPARKRSCPPTEETKRGLDHGIGHLASMSPQKNE